MHELDRHGPFTHGRGDALDRAGAHVTGGKHPGTAGFQQEGLPLAVQWGDCAKDGPVRTNSLASRSISAGSHSVRGTAPMKLNSAGVCE